MYNLAFTVYPFASGSGFLFGDGALGARLNISLVNELHASGKIFFFGYGKIFWISPSHTTLTHTLTRLGALVGVNLFELDRCIDTMKQTRLIFSSPLSRAQPVNSCLCAFPWPQGKGFEFTSLSFIIKERLYLDFKKFDVSRYRRDGLKAEEVIIITKGIR